jgi:hypothetical protein
MKSVLSTAEKDLVKITEHPNTVNGIRGLTECGQAKVTAPQYQEEKQV